MCSSCTVVAFSWHMIVEIVHKTRLCMRNKHEHLRKRYPTPSPVACRLGHVLVRLRSNRFSLTADRL
ncbi:hypothetical protein BDV93DRAFT_122148 [Ceratobasidium sp. AG-I]|nr:hypothetical protein BDV93DRAFT_122148 [Ceratobasidium sp. AG-I]